MNRQKGDKDNNYVVERYENDGGAGFAGNEAEKVSRATIGNGTIGRFTDKISFFPQFVDGKSNEEIFKVGTFKAIKQVEDFIDLKLYNQEAGIIPTSGQYGAVGEFILKSFVENKVEGIIIKGKGNTVESMTKIERLDDLPYSDEPKNIFGNGMAEEFERAVINAVNQYIPENAIKNGEEFEITLTYNPTMGRVWDGIESIFGKFFNGKGEITTGIAKGYNTLIRTHNPDQQYNFRQYSQGNLYFEGGINLAIKSRDMLFTNISVDHTGNPRADKIFNQQSSVIGYTNLGSASNFTDGIASEDGDFLGTKGIISEKKQVNLEGIENHQKKFIQDNFKGITALATIETDTMLMLPTFLNESKKDKLKNEKDNQKNENILTFTDDEIKKVVVTQRIIGNIRNEDELNKYINKKIEEKTERKENETVIEAKKEQAKKEIMDDLRKRTAEELSPHRLYFPESFEYSDKLREVEKEKEALYLRWINEKDSNIKENLKEQYKNLVNEQKKYQTEFQTVIKERLINTPMVKPEDVIEFRNDILIEEMNSDFPRNNSYDIEESNIPDLKRQKPEENERLTINDELKHLRERIGK